MRKALIFIVIAVCIAGIVLHNMRIGRKVKEEKLSAIKREKAAEVEKVAEIEKVIKIALVIDDFGYNLKNTNKFFELGIPITLSILPNLPYSKQIATKANQKNYQVILHLPLEPLESTKPIERGTILCGMEPKEVVEKLEHAMLSIPNLAGISNHMGSKATTNAKLMSILFERMKKDNLFFMDNLVTSDSVCKKTAKRVGIRFIHRSVFLDNESDLDYIKNQIKELEYQASNTGWAVGVGHDRSMTLEAIKQMIPQLKKNGVEFVFLSDLAK